MSVEWTYDKSIKVHDFLCKVKSLCEQYGLVISHEDGHGAFIIEPLNDLDIQHFMEAFDRTEEEKVLSGEEKGEQN